MDMKKILQALDGASSKPVEGSNDMKRFLRAVTEADVNQPAALPAAPKFYITQTTYDTPGAGEDFAVTDLQRGIVVKSFDSEQEARAFVAQQDPAGAAQTELHQVQSKATAPEANPDAAPQAVAEDADIKHLLKIMEGKGPLNRLTAAESMAMQATAKKKTITNPVLNVKEDAKPSMIGKYFKTIQEELLEAEQKHKERATVLAKKVIERVTIGPDGQVTGGLKPTPADPNAPAKPEPAPEPAATLPGKDLPRAEKADRNAQTVTVDGQEYEMVWLEPGGIRPRGGQRFSLPMAMLGIRGIGNYIGIIAGGKAYMLPKGEQESVQEQYTYKDIAEMARLGYSDQEIAESLGFDLTEGLKDPKDNPCWKGYKPVGTKKKGGRTVPNCVPTSEAANAAQQAAIAIAKKKKAGKK